MEETARTQDFDSTTRESLLDVILDRMQKSGKSTIISRMLLVGRINSRQANADCHKGFFGKIVEKVLVEGDITGLVLVYPYCVAAVFEGKTGLLLTLLRELHSSPQADSKFHEVRVVCCTEDIPSRCYSAFYVGYIPSLSNADTADPLDAATGVKYAADLNSFLRKLGPTLSSVSESELKKRLYAMDSYYDDIPAAEAVLSLCATEDAPLVEEFLDLFDAPINVDLDSEKVWPMPAQLKY